MDVCPPSRRRPPTNNAAERAIRHAVIWRKISLGTDSEQGSRFVERMLTVVQTLRMQRRNILDFVAESCQAAIHKVPGPSLLPPRQQVRRWQRDPVGERVQRLNCVFEHAPETGSHLTGRDLFNKVTHVYGLTMRPLEVAGISRR